MAVRQSALWRSTPRLDIGQEPPAAAFDAVDHQIVHVAAMSPQLVATQEIAARSQSKGEGEACSLASLDPRRYAGDPPQTKN
jgi:hypothetical protein